MQNNYRKTHQTKTAALGHIKNIEKRGGTASLLDKKGVYEVSYDFNKHPIKVTKEGGFKGTKIQLSNTTVKKFINGNAEIEYMIFAGKGSGSQIFGTTDYKEALSFNDNYPKNLEYRNIWNKKTNNMGGAYFYKGTEKMFGKTHPFKKDGYKFTR